MDNRYDIAIIGSGPAGVSAALNASIRKKKYIIFGSKSLSTKLEKSEQINNYPGFPAIKGADLKKKFLSHLEQMNIEITEKTITSVYNMGDYFSLVSGSDIFEATTLIIATGVTTSKTLAGEDEFLGRGVGYCATCDAVLYKGKTVTIIAYSKKEEAEADFLATVASKVYYVPMYKEEVKVDKSIEIIYDKPKEIKGDRFVTSVVFENSEIKTDGVFILRDSISPSKLIDGIELDNNHIKVDRKMATNIKGCFACGDITGAPYQYAKAVGEGNVASLSAVSYLSLK